MEIVAIVACLIVLVGVSLGFIITHKRSASKEHISENSSASEKKDKAFVFSVVQPKMSDWEKKKRKLRRRIKGVKVRGVKLRLAA